MKLRLFHIIIAALLSVPTMAQRYGVVDTEYILANMPEYEQAKSQLNKLSEQWAGEVSALQSELQSLKYYGTLNSEITRLWEQEQHILFDIDVQGGLTIKEKFPDQTLALFIQPPSVEELEARLRKRATDDEVKIQERLHKAQTELEYATQFDQIIINDDLETAKKEIVQCVKHFIES